MGKRRLVGAVLLCISLAGCSEKAVPYNTSQPQIEKSKVELKIVEIQPEDHAQQFPIKVEKGVDLDPIIQKDILKKKDELSTPIAGLFKTSLESLLQNGKITLNFSIQNVSGKAQEISHGSGQKYDIFVYNEQNAEVFRWSINKAFTEALIIRSLNQDEKLAFTEEWNLQDNRGNPIPPGIYKIQIKVMISLKLGVISP